MTKPLDNDFSGQKREAQPTLPFDPAQVDRCGIRLTRADFARFLGVSKQAVGEWVASGKIVLGADGRLDPRQAVAQLLRNSDPAKLRAKVLAPLLRDVGTLQRRIAELESELARVKEERDFEAGAARELQQVPDALLFLLGEEWPALRAVEPERIEAALDDVFRRACALAAQEAEPEPLIPGVPEIRDVSFEERAWLAQQAQELADLPARKGIVAPRAACETEGEGGRSMKPALAISLLVREPEERWEFVAQVRGRPVYHGGGYDTPAEAFAAAVTQMRGELQRERAERERPN